MTTSSATLDFEALLSRDYRPARVTRLVPREAYNPAQTHHHKTAVQKQQPTHEQEAISSSAVESLAARRQRQALETSRLVLQLVTQTPAFSRHLTPHEREKTRLTAAALLTDSVTKNKNERDDDDDYIPPSFHQVELGDWESKINWQGCPDDVSQEAATTGAATAGRIQQSNAMELLKRPRNPHLDAIRFDSSTVCFDGNAQDFLEKARKAPLILELGVAGQSVAKHVYQNTVLSAQRPTPALQSAAYQNRMDRDWSGQVTSTAELNKGSSLHADKDQMEAMIQARQKKRAQMAMDKTSRVTEAMGTLALGGGRGRTITSSLMGPGGTERTGRPTRAAHSLVAHDSEYTEQLDMVTHHTLVRDLSKVLLRQYHRPKLPLSVVRQDLSWQLQICYASSNAKKDGAASTSYQSIMMGPGAVSKDKLRTEADLTPAEGDLVLLEYCEEKPPLQLTKGMGWKIINYYRGDRSRCPVSRGGGDRPARRKREGKPGSAAARSIKQLDRLPRLGDTSRATSIMDWVGELPKKTQRSEKEPVIDVLPEGRTEILHPKVHGPFIGELEEGKTLTGCITNLFVAPMFRYDAESTDFLMILTTPGGASRAGQRERMGVVLRELPICFTVGQTEPRTRVYAPNTQGEKSFIGPWVSFQIARSLARAHAREGHGLRFDELQDRVMPNLELAGNQLRQRLKQVAIYDKNTQIWTSKAIGEEDYPGVEALGKMTSPEKIAAFESACAASRRLSDLGIHQLLERGFHTVTSVGVIMVYLAGQLNAAREFSRKTKKLLDISKTNKSIQPLQAAYYEAAANDLENYFKAIRQKYEIAKFIYEEMQLAPWHLTGEYIDVHKKGEGTGMMKLTGLGDPSGKGEGFSFLREADSKPSKSIGNDALRDQVKKITGTEDDLRKLTMKQMASLLRSYGMAQKDIDTLKRWDRVHVIRDLSTKAQQDGIGDGLERFARGEKMKLYDQKQMYLDRVQVIWRRQLAALSMDARGPAADGGAAAGDQETEDPSNTPVAQAKTAKDNDDEDDDSDDEDDLAAALEDEMMDRSEAHHLVAAHARGSDAENAPGQLRAAAQDQDLTKDARELAALKRQREEERQTQVGLQSMLTADNSAGGTLGVGRKIIRRRITKTHPDGRQTATFKFILDPEEVGKMMDRLQQSRDYKKPRSKEVKYERGIDEKPPGHAFFEEDDDFEYSSKGRHHAGSRRGGGRRRGGGGGGGGSGGGGGGSRAATPRGRILQLGGKLKIRVSKEERMRKRKREEEELEVYTTTAKRKGTNNRRERGSIRDRRPHVIYAEKLESIRAQVESRPYAGPFVKPVNRRLIPRYYEVISHPIDLQTIRDRISRYEYRSADVLLRDFELMKSNAIKFNGEASPIAHEAISIYDFVKDKIMSNRSELAELETAVDDQMSGKPKKKQKTTKNKSPGAGGSILANMGGVNVNLGDLDLDGIDDDSDGSLMDS